MPLVPTSEHPEREGLAVRWTMSDGKRSIVCWVRAAALEKLESNIDLKKEDYVAAFTRHRSILEEQANAIFARGLLDGNAIVIRPENV